MFATEVAAMKAAPQVKPREDWLMTIAELFAISHRAVSLDAERVPSAKKRYSKRKGDERALMYNLFREECVLDSGDFEDWDRSMTTVTQDLYNSEVSLKYLLQSRISKTEWARLPPLNQWSAKVRTGPVGRGRATTSSTQRGRYLPFIFNPAVYSTDDITRLHALCTSPDASVKDCRLHEGTADEWKIITGIAESSIVCRWMLDFLRSVLDSKERLHLYNTIHQQVEGELVLHLRSWVNIITAKQHTRTFKDDILMAAAALGARINLPELQAILHLTKTISFNFVERSIHFYFFDRATVHRYQNIKVSFRGLVYSVANPHRPVQGSVWNRQLGRDGVRLARQREYEILLYNITRYTDVGRLTTYLQLPLPVYFEIDDLDGFNPYSTTSMA